RGSTGKCAEERTPPRVRPPEGSCPSYRRLGTPSLLPPAAARSPSTASEIESQSIGFRRRYSGALVPVLFAASVASTPATRPSGGGLSFSSGAARRRGFVLPVAHLGDRGVPLSPQRSRIPHLDGAADDRRQPVSVGTKGDHLCRPVQFESEKFVAVH